FSLKPNKLMSRLSTGYSKACRLLTDNLFAFSINNNYLQRNGMKLGMDLCIKILDGFCKLPKHSEIDGMLQKMEQFGLKPTTEGETIPFASHLTNMHSVQSYPRQLGSK